MSAKYRTSGQTMIEFAMVFPLLIFLILGLFDLGRAVFYFATLNTAVREATRDAIVLPSEVYDLYISGSHTELTTSVENSLGEFLFTKQLKDACVPSHVGVCEVVPQLIPPTLPPTDPTISYDPKVQVTIIYQFEAITPGISLIIGNGGKFQIKVQSSMLLTPFAKPQ